MTNKKIHKAGAAASPVTNNETSPGLEKADTAAAETNAPESETIGQKSDTADEKTEPSIQTEGDATGEAKEGQAPKDIDPETLKQGEEVIDNLINNDGAETLAAAHAAAEAQRRKNLVDMATLFELEHEDVGDEALNNRVIVATRALMTKADRHGIKYEGDESMESKAAFIALVNEAESRTVARTYVVLWDLQRGRRYVEGDEIDLTDAEAATITSGCIRLK